MTTIHVSAERPYDVTVGHGAVAGLPDAVAGCDRVAVLHPPVLADQVVAWTAGIAGDVVPIVLPDGETAKTAAVLDACWGALADAGFTRSDAVVGIGGGATTDLAGFVASTWLRGVRYVSVPTTVLAMVDAAVGGKTGIDLPHGKNLVGAFWEPAAVLADLDALVALPVDELRGGLAEMIKHGFIADPRTLELFEADPAAMLDPTSAALAEGIERSITVKAAVVSADLREATSVGKSVGRELLNYGHTLAHAIEKREHYTWRHGDAVAVGLNYAATLSHRLGHLDAAGVERHRTILASVGLPTTYDAGAWADLRATMSLDKKARGASVRFVLLDGVADPFVAVAPDEAVLAATYDEIAS
jgi:3-dehydroquinate synthase